MFTPPTGFEDRKALSPSYDSVGTSDDDEKRLAFCLAFLSEKTPDLALLVQRWDTLPAVLKTGIVAMVRGAAHEG